MKYLLFMENVPKPIDTVENGQKRNDRDIQKKKEKKIHFRFI